MVIVSTMKHRSRTDIIVSMLKAARHGGTKTKIMYSSYLSSHQLRAYLELVIRNSLLAYDSTKQRYRTTDKGLRLLELYDNIGKLELAPSAWTTSQK
jgi:predicted transcriptional regulator